MASLAGRRATAAAAAAAPLLRREARRHASAKFAHMKVKKFNWVEASGARGAQLGLAAAETECWRSAERWRCCAARHGPPAGGGTGTTL
jgi:hypothetical protein